MIDIIIKFNTTEQMIVCVDLHNTIYSIKKLIEDLENIPIDSQQLLFKFKYMSDDKTIGDYNINNNSIIYFSNRNSSENIKLRELLKNIFNKHLNKKIYESEQQP
jgi:hypothetical protein